MPATFEPAGPTGTTTFHGIANAFAEVCHADGWIPGLIILAGLAFASWKVGTWALTGTVLVALAYLLPGFELAEFPTGIYAYCSLLVAIALGATFLEGTSTATRLCLLLIGVCVALIVQWAITSLSLPLYTWPFLIGTWVPLLGYRWWRSAR